MNDNIKVSIFCLTYNQNKYIKQALDSMLMQEVNFNFEILVNDDFSDDGTKEILIEYQKKYPKIVRLVLHKSNEYSKGKRNFISRYLMPIANGKYYAICEGDDYWTDPLKLQKQVDFLDNNPEYTICFHKVNIVYENKQKKEEIYPNVDEEGWYSLKELFKTNYIQTNSVMYRAIDYSNIATNIMPSDWYMHLFHARYGKIKLINEVMSVYRKHQKGIWWSYDIDRDAVWSKHGLAHLNMWIELKIIYSGKSNYINIINEQIDTMVETLARVDNKYQTTFINEVINTQPKIIEQFIHKNEMNIEELQKKYNNLQAENNKLSADNNRLQEELSKIKYEYEQIQKSKIWKLRNTIKRK